MFIKIEAPDGFPLSWCLSKAPDGIFDRPLSKAAGSGRVVGFFDGGAYVLVMENDPFAFTQRLKAANMDCYVQSQAWSVCPSNLAGMETALKSALSGDAKGAPEGAMERAERFSCEIGPFRCFKEMLLDRFRAYGFEVSVTREEGRAFSVRTTCAGGEPLPVFLRKVYVLALSCTWNDDMWNMTEGRVAKLARLCADWLGQSPEAAPSVGWSLCKKNGKDVKLFREMVPAARWERPSEPRLHDVRHDTVADLVPEDAKVILELGCGGGRMAAKVARRLPDAKVYGVDAGENTAAAARRLGYLKNLVLRRGNLLWPEIPEDVDTVMASEVMEHLDRRERALFAGLVFRDIAPKTVILTVPNILCNGNWDMPEGKLRHPGHRLEYTPEDLEAEIGGPAVAAGYLVSVKGLGEAGENGQHPSWLVVCVKEAAEKTAKGKRSKRVAPRRAEVVRDVHLDLCGKRIPARDLAQGQCVPALCANPLSVFHVGPTIAPAPWFDDGTGESGGFLEHPLGCFAYFRDKGVTRLAEQVKHMGSRAYGLVFRDRSMADCFGMDQATLLARSGMPFEKSLSGPLALAMADDMLPHMREAGCDFMLVDGEMTPWRLKAGKLIERDFETPGNLAMIHREWAGQNTSSVSEYQAALSRFTGDGEPALNLFGVMAKGKIDRRGRVRDETYGFAGTHVGMAKEIALLAGDLVKPTGTVVVDLNDRASVRESVRRWERFCAEGGEGFVYKPLPVLSRGRNLFPMIPAMKVRGKDYLRIIYGMDYLRPDMLRMLKDRNIGPKRALSAVQHVLSAKITAAFLNKDVVRRLSLLCAFHGLERTTAVDATL